MFEKPILNRRSGYIDYSAIVTPDIHLYMLLGQRSDGKTYGIVHEAVKEYMQTGTPSAYVRRFDVSLKKSELDGLLNPHINYIEKTTKGEYNTVTYKSKKFYLAHYDSDAGKNDRVSETPVLYCYSMNTWETAKGRDVGALRYVIFDEYVSSVKYLPNEYQIWNNVLSSLIRNRDGTDIFMLANPINQICPYFDEYGIEPHRYNPGDVVVKTYPNGTQLKFVYVPAMDEKHRKSNSIFEIGSGSTSITSGYWEIGDFPHMQGGVYKQSEKLAHAYLQFRGQQAGIDFMLHGEQTYIFCYPQRFTQELLQLGDAVLYTDIEDMRAGVFYNLHNKHILSQLIITAMQQGRAYYSDNRTGQLIKYWYDNFKGV